MIAVNWVSVTNGTAGLTLPLPTWDFEILNWPFYYALCVILALQLVMSWWIQRTKFGMGLVAIREDETKAATVGINLPVEKILAFVASTVFVGAAGAVYGYYLTFIDPRGMFGILLSVQIVLSLLVGGKGTLWGPVIGAFLSRVPQRAGQQPARRRQHPAADLRRAADRPGAVPAHRDPAGASRAC